MEGFHSVAYGGHFLWCAVFVTSQFDVILMFPSQRFGEVYGMTCMFFYTYSPFFMSLCTEYKLSALQVRISEENKLNAATQEFITATKGSKTHSSLRQSNLQLQNEAALMFPRIRAVEHRCAAGLAGAHPVFQDRILMKYTAGLPTYLHQKKPQKPRWPFWGTHT